MLRRESSTGSDASHAAALADQEVPLFTIDAEIVGCRYYTGAAHRGEYVTLVREPSNPYDRNAIAVANMRGHKVGHLARTMAAVLAPLLDDRTPGAAKFEATIPRDAYNMFTLDCTLEVIGTLDKAAAVMAHLRRGHVRFRETAATSGSSSASAAAAAAAAAAANVVLSRTIVSSARSQADLDALLDKLTAAPSPPFDPATTPALLSSLYDFQLAGVAWMLQRERNPDAANSGLPPFWRRVNEHGSNMFFNEVTNSSQPQAPERIRGGLLADDMGLGKSVQMIAAILGNPPTGTTYTPWRLRPEGAPVVGMDETPSASQSLPAAAEEKSAPVSAAPEVSSTPAAAAGGGGAGGGGPDYSSMSLKELQTACKFASLAKSGTKAQLVERLKAKAVVAALTQTAGGAIGGAAVLGGKATPSSSGSDLPVSKNLGTLIVCPVSVLSSWEDQFAKHVAPETLRVYTYAGSGRITDPAYLALQDVILVSYSTLASEHSNGGPTGSKRKAEGRPAAGILALDWHRVVLDEAHSIRNRDTRAYAATTSLNATYRWCLTGTPIQNRADDAQPIFAFLRATPLSDWGIWTRAVGRPLRQGDDMALNRLRLLLSAISLRRTKALLASKLPPKAVEMVTVKLDERSREAYDSLFRSARRIIEAAYIAEGDGAILSSMAPVLECILRLRQCANAVELVPPERLKRAAEVLARLEKRVLEKPDVAVTKEEAAKLLAALAGTFAESEPDCCVCMNPLSQSTVRVLRSCRHTFCEECVDQLIARSSMTCPLCRGPFTASDVLSSSALSQYEESKEGEGASAVGGEAGGESAVTSMDVGKDGLASALASTPPKLVALLGGLAAMRAKDPSCKAVVFSQFTSFLDVVQKVLSAHGWESSRLDGTMVVQARRVAIARWREPNSSGAPPVLVVSSRAGGVGLTLTEANYVYMMEPLWNPAAEEQAMDRVHRLGQTRPVSVVRYFSEKTIEENIYRLQQAKAMLGKGALQKLTAEESRKVRAKELRNLFDIDDAAPPAE